MNKFFLPIFFFLITGFITGTTAQERRAIEMVGGARSFISNNNINVGDITPDTTTVKRNTGGYALIDLGIDIAPAKNVEILGMFRITNNYGGFWGAGVSFDVRQLWLKGIISDVVRYQLGDLNLKQTPFTLYNPHADRPDSLPDIFKLQNEIIDYEKFYMSNTWRSQGANVDFGINVTKWIKQLNFNGYLARLNATDFASVPDRLMGGVTAEVVQSSHLSLQYNGFWVFDVKGTVNDSNWYRNSVNSIAANYTTGVGKQKLTVHAEAGKSHLVQTGDESNSLLDDYFIHAEGGFQIPASNLGFTAGYLNVGPDFRSVGAQSKDINYSASPDFYNRYTNAQVVRPLSMMDVVRDDMLYKTSVTSELMTINPLYNNITPYGMATFNRQGVYGGVAWKWSKGIAIQARFDYMSEIRGQGTFSLKNMTRSKLYTTIDMDELTGYQKRFKIHGGVDYQTTMRNSDMAVENVDLKTWQYQAGLEFEFIRNIEFLFGIMDSYTKGNDFIAYRDKYSKVEVFDPMTVEVNQFYPAAGLRFRFLKDHAYLSAIYQSCQWTDYLENTADYDINQFALIFNMTF